jgi:acyl carrier protein
MTEREIRDAILTSLHAIAPEIDMDEIDHGKPIGPQMDVDSIDFLNVLMAIDEKTGVDIPERDYPKVQTIDDTVAYVAQRVPKPTS